MCRPVSDEAYLLSLWRPAVVKQNSSTRHDGEGGADACRWRRPSHHKGRPGRLRATKAAAEGKLSGSRKLDVMVNVRRGRRKEAVTVDERVICSE